MNPQRPSSPSNTLRVLGHQLGSMGRLLIERWGLWVARKHAHCHMSDLLQSSLLPTPQQMNKVEQ